MMGLGACGTADQSQKEEVGEELLLGRACVAQAQESRCSHTDMGYFSYLAGQRRCFTFMKNRDGKVYMSLRSPRMVTLTMVR